MYPVPQALEDINSIRDAMRQISQEAEAVVELLDLRIEDEHLDGRTEAEDDALSLNSPEPQPRGKRGVRRLPRAVRSLT
jgi:hypothetical protein